MKILVKVLWEVLVKTLGKSPKRSLHDLVQVPLWEDLVKILLKLSSRGPCLVLVWKFFWDVHRKFLHEDLVRSSICPSLTSLTIFWYSLMWGSCMRSGWVDISLLLVPKQLPAAAVPVMSKLICYCSIVTVACIRDIDFLPPTYCLICLGSLAGVFFFHMWFGGYNETLMEFNHWKWWLHGICMGFNLIRLYI